MPGGTHSNREPISSAPAAIVLCKVATGLGTVRGLAEAGVDVHAITFSRSDPIHWSNQCHKVPYMGRDGDAELVGFVRNYAEHLGNRPAVFPSSDSQALLLARHRGELDPYCRIWSNESAALSEIVSKAGLYRAALCAGISIVPSVIAPTLEELGTWSESNDGPYFLKPFYEGITGAGLQRKNAIVATREQLLSFAAKSGTQALIVQRAITGGDGNVLDCYGLCDRTGRVVTTATHRRLRQHPAHAGSTCLGEIPAYQDPTLNTRIVDLTRQLLATVRYHGIFGIEWLHEPATGRLYLIDFNARPFTSIGHLTASGLNLPALAFRELQGEDLSQMAANPPLEHVFWIDFLHDMTTLPERLRAGELTLGDWFASLLKCRSFAYLSLRDPGPGLHRFLELGYRTGQYLRKRLLGEPVAIDPLSQPDQR